MTDQKPWINGALALLLAIPLFFTDRAFAATPCANLAALTIPDVSITSATLIPADSFVLPGAATSTKLPAFCRVAALARPTSDSFINLEVWIPAAGVWNGKFQGVGNNAFLGAISYAAMVDALRSGYATASSDAGHTGGELDFAVGHPEKVVDWSYRSAHITAEVGKLVVRNATGKWPERAYFIGCDTGGHQALMEAQRYPEDYDGIVAGVPAADRVNEIVGYLGVWMATHDEKGAALLPLSKLQLVTKSAVAACDELDGVKDGVIDDPRRCKFDPQSLVCKAGETESCLTLAQVAAVKKVYAGVKNPRTGKIIFPGWPIGSEGFGEAGQSWSSMVNGPSPRRVEFFNGFVFNDPKWDWRTFDFDKDTSYADTKVEFINAVNPDLERFRARGGKLIMYAGWVDPILPAEDVIDYFGKIGATMGAKNVDSFLRFFMVPGLGHCSGGPGPTAFDMVPALEQWVERGVTPAKVVAARIVDKTVQRTRPLCPYPSVARWTGKGSSDDATNFVCKAVEK